MNFSKDLGNAQLLTSSVRIHQTLAGHYKGYSLEFKESFTQYLQSFRNPEAALSYSLTTPHHADNVHNRSNKLSNFNSLI